MKKTKLPNDVAQRAKRIMELATDTIEIPHNKQNAYMTSLASKGGKARAAALTRKERKSIAKKAAAARWGKK
jgi:hypothetical protein